MNTDDCPGAQQPVNELRFHAAHSAIADVLSETGCPFPNAVGDLLLARLHGAGFYLVRQDKLT